MWADGEFQDGDFGSWDGFGIGHPTILLELLSHFVEEFDSNVIS